MHVLEYLHRNVKTVAMPSAMVAGALLCRPVTALEAWTHQMITPSLIFLMLFVTFCRVKPRQMKPSMLHVWLLLFQVVVSAALYFTLLPLDAIVAQGAMICVLAPVAMAAVVIAGMLGANVPTMATYSLLCNMAIALIAPVVLSLAGTGACSFTQILARIAPLLIMPFAAAQFCRFLLPKTAKWIGDHSQISFYMWLASLVVIIGRTTAFIIDLHDASLSVELWLAFAALAICLVQFKVAACSAAVTGTRRRAGSRSARRTRCWPYGWRSRSSTPSPRSPRRLISCGRTSSIPIRFIATISGSRIERLRRRAFLPPAIVTKNRTAAISGRGCLVCMRGCYRTRVISGR